MIQSQDFTSFTLTSLSIMKTCASYNAKCDSAVNNNTKCISVHTEDLKCTLPLKTWTPRSLLWPPDCSQRSMIAGCRGQGHRALILCILGYYRNESATVVLLSDANQQCCSSSSTFKVVVRPRRGGGEDFFHAICPLASSTEASSALWAKPATGGGRGMPMIPSLSS